MNDTMKHSRSPYRIEDARVCIDIRLHTARQMFDGRDPAPFRERDLDQGAVEYILEAAEEAPKQHPLKLVVWLTESSPSVDDTTMINAIAAYFRYQDHRLGKQIRGHVKEGQIKLVLGFLVLGVFLTLARLCTMRPEGTFRDVLAEGLSIVGWVAMWRPVEVLLYDWWPIVLRRRLLRRVTSAEISIQHRAASVVPMVPLRESR